MKSPPARSGRTAPKPGGSGTAARGCTFKAVSGLTPSPSAPSRPAGSQPDPCRLPASARTCTELFQASARHRQWPSSGAQAGGSHLLPVGGSSLRSTSEIWSFSRGSGCKFLPGSWARAQLCPGTASHAGTAPRARIRCKQQSAGSRFPAPAPWDPGCSGDEANLGLQLSTPGSQAAFPRGRGSVHPMAFGCQSVPGDSSIPQDKWSSSFSFAMVFTSLSPVIRLGPGSIACWVLPRAQHRCMGAHGRRSGS